MRMKKLGAGLAVGIAVLGTLVLTSPASAAPTETAAVPSGIVVKANLERGVIGRYCGVNQLCRIRSTTTGYAYHFRDGSLSASFPSTTALTGRTSTSTAGFGSGLVRAGWVDSASSDCWCPPGVTCGV